MALPPLSRTGQEVFQPGVSGGMAAARPWATEMEYRDALLDSGKADVADVAALHVEVDEVRSIAETGVKPPYPVVRLLVTTDVNLATDAENGDTLDGETLVTGDLIAKAYNGEAGAADNGVYVVQASGAAVRASFANTSDELLGGRFYVAEGTHANTWFAIGNTAALTVGTTPVVIRQTTSPDATAGEVVGSRDGMLDLPSRLARDAIVSDAGRYALDTVDTFAVVPSQVKLSTDDGNIVGLSYAIAGGLALTKTGTTGIAGLQTAFANVAGPISFEIDVTITTVVSGSQNLAFALGDGASRQWFVWGASGGFVRYGQAGTGTLLGVLLSSSASRAWAVGDELKIKIEIDEDQNAAITLIADDGSEHPAFASAIPVGALTLGLRANGTYTFTRLASTGSISLTIAEPNPAAVGPARELSPPSNLAGWAPAVRFYVDGEGRISHDYNPIDHLPFTPSTATHVRFVDAVNGDDNLNDGDSASSPFQSLHAAVHNVTGNIWVWIKGDCDRQTGFGGATIAANGIVLLPWDVPEVTISNHFPGLVWTLASGLTNTYETTVPATAIAAWDAGVDDEGLYTRLTPGDTSGGTVELGEGEYEIDGTTVYVRAADSRDVSGDATDLIRVMADAPSFSTTLPGLKLWFDRVNWEGGVRIIDYDYSSGAKGYIWASNGHIRYSSGSNGAFRPYGDIDVISLNMLAEETEGDGMAYARGRAIEIDCGYRRNGFNAGSNNNSTGHQAQKIIRANTGRADRKYLDAEKRPIHDVGSCKVWLLGIDVGASRTAGEEGVSIVAGHPTSGPDTTITVAYRVTIDGDSPYAFATYFGSYIEAYQTNRNGVADFTGADVRPLWPY